MPTDKTVDHLLERITELEIKQSYFEGGQHELDQALVRMQTRIDKLSNEINRLKVVIEARPEQPVAPLSEETPPPHY